MARHAFRSTCSIARSLELMGDKWTLLIVRDLMWHGKRTFQALQDSAERVPSNILSQRLKRLAEWGLVRRDAYKQRPVRYAYRLTDEGNPWSLCCCKSWRGGTGTSAVAVTIRSQARAGGRQRGRRALPKPLSRPGEGD